MNFHRKITPEKIPIVEWENHGKSWKIMENHGKSTLTSSKNAGFPICEDILVHLALNHQVYSLVI
jgi:hypothetical protein